MDDTAPDERGLESNDTEGSGEAAARSHGWRTWQLIVAVVLVAALATTIGLVVGRRTDTNEQVSTATIESTVTTESTGTTASDGDTTVPETGYTPPAPVAAQDLDAFLTRAAATDQALTEAALRINASTTASEITYEQRTYDLLGSATPDIMAPSLPPGMPDELQRAALLVYSDLVSRWGAMGSIDCNHGVGTFPRSEFDDYGCFTQGAAAAARFDGDLAALKQLAGTTPKFTVPSQNSQAAEELAARIHFIDENNLGCAGVGGFVATDPIPVVWQTHPAADGLDPWQGTVGGIDFRGTYDPVRGWLIQINAC